MMWMHDRAEPITWIEYDFWMRHTLPFGWAILCAPQQDKHEAS